MKSKLRAVDLVVEALSNILQRPGRAVLTTLGTVLGVGASIAILGLAATAAGQVSRRFTLLMATEVTVEAVEAPVQPSAAFPFDADSRIRALNGVRNGGVYWPVDHEETGDVSVIPLPGEAGGRQTVLAASPGYLRAIGPTTGEGRLFDEYHELHAERVAIVGGALAAHLKIADLGYQPAIFIGGTPFSVIGIVDQVQRRPETLLEVIVPASTALQLWGEPKGRVRMLIETDLGAAQLVGAQAPLALRPATPEWFKVVTPPDPHSLRDNVNTDLASLFLVLAGICLVIGAVGIANTTLVAVMERIPEIGLRRALGARRWHVALQFLTESALIGLIGGLVGAAVGTTAIVCASIVNQWTPVMVSWTVGVAPLAGLVVGLLAGLYPAIRAARVEPVEALRALRG